VLEHPRFRLHIVTARGRHVLRREHRIGTPLGYLGAFVSNVAAPQGDGRLAGARGVLGAGAGRACPCPSAPATFRRGRCAERSQLPAGAAGELLDPFVLQAVHDIPGAPRGAYWDGGITDYHLHLKYDCGPGPGLVLYPHFQKAVVPGWLDKGLKWRHRATPASTA
jgi:hypothetical protein